MVLADDEENRQKKCLTFTAADALRLTVRRWRIGTGAAKGYQRTAGKAFRYGVKVSAPSFVLSPHACARERNRIDLKALPKIGEAVDKRKQWQSHG